MNDTVLHNRRWLLSLLLLAAMTLFFSAMQSAHAQQVPAWAPNSAYAVNAKVTYQGSVYQCRQAHTSIVTWEPINTPALWLNIGTDNGGGGNGGDTQAPTAPTNVRITATTSSSVALAWNASSDNVGVTRYDIVQNATTLHSRA